jgi:hypothetical protein
MMPAAKLDNPPPRRAPFRPARVRCVRPGVDIARLEGAMKALEGYVDILLAVVEGVDRAPSIYDDELDPRVACA